MSILSVGGVSLDLQASKSEETVQPDPLRPSELQLSREHHGHDVQHEIGRKHDVAVGVEEVAHVHAVSGDVAPSLVDRSALEEVHEDAGAAKAESDEVHDVNGDLVAALTSDVRVEQKQCMFDCPIAEEVEDIRYQSKL